jgi:RNA polymerase sigma-70 factor (ECF subfamily)
MRQITFSLARPAVLDEAVFAALYHEYTGAIFNYCLFRVGNRGAAEDLTADIFERAWRARGRYRPKRGTFATWLFSIARRRVIDWQRRQGRRPLAPLAEGHPDDALSPEDLAQQSEQLAALRGLLLELRGGEQELIALKFGAGMTNCDIALLLGKSETAVGSAIHRVMVKLRTRWEEYDGQPTTD